MVTIEFDVCAYYFDCLLLVVVERVTVDSLATVPASVAVVVVVVVVSMAVCVVVVDEIGLVVVVMAVMVVEVVAVVVSVEIGRYEQADVPLLLSVSE